MTHIKICGIDTVRTAELAAKCGATAIGINLIPGSARYRGLSEARDIARSVRGSCCVVALFADADADTVGEVCELVEPEVLQFHGEESPAFCEQFLLPYLKALRADADLGSARQRYAAARGWLVDASAGGRFGGTGETFDWGLFPREPDRPWILAGGLNPDNVGLAIEAVRPWAVDVSTGVEGPERGVKDPVRLKAFCDAVAQADRRLTQT